MFLHTNWSYFAFLCIFPIPFLQEFSWPLGTVISACEKAVRWPEILSILDGMLPRVSPNEVSLGAAIAACEKAAEGVNGRGSWGLPKGPSLRHFRYFDHLTTCCTFYLRVNLTDGFRKVPHIHQSFEVLF